MEIINKIHKLAEDVRDEEALRIYEAMIKIGEYTTLISRRNFDAIFNSIKDKSGIIEISKAARAELDEQYEICLKELELINEISKENDSSNIYDGDYTREDVDSFLLKLSNEAFDARSL